MTQFKYGLSPFQPSPGRRARQEKEALLVSVSVAIDSV